MFLGRHIFVVASLTLTMLFLVGCGQEQTNPTVVGAQADTTMVVTKEGDTSKSTEIRPWTPDGKAKVIYDYVQKSPPAWEMSAHVDIPMEIEADPTKPKGPWVVTGKKEGVLYATAFGEGAQGLCTVKCDFTGTYSVEGELSHLDDPANECGFKLNISAIFDPDKVARSGTCPSIVVQQFGCEVLLIFPQNTGSNPWVYNRASPMMLIKKPNADAEEKVTLSGVELPEDVTCVDWEIP